MNRRSIATAAVLVAFAGLLVAGCSVVQTVTNQFSEFYETALAPAEEKVVYAAAQTSLEAMGYAHERGSPSGHRLEMSTRIQPGSSAQNLRQRRVVLEFRAMGSQGTDVRVGFWEVSEESGQSTTAVSAGRLIRGGTLYEAFWDRLGKTLPEKPVISVTGAPEKAPAEPAAPAP